MRVLVCGDRNWQDYNLIYSEVEKSGATHIIEGDARGADRIAGSVANALGLGLSIYPADWDRNGRAAGPLRNMQMLDEGKPDKVLAFHDNIEYSKGTKHMVTYARSKGVPVEIFSHSKEVKVED